VDAGNLSIFCVFKNWNLVVKYGAQLRLVTNTLDMNSKRNSYDSYLRIPLEWIANSDNIGCK
jgi:hypothetical protein